MKLQALQQLCIHYEAPYRKGSWINDHYMKLIKTKPRFHNMVPFKKEMFFAIPASANPQKVRWKDNVLQYLAKEQQFAFLQTHPVSQAVRPHT